MIYDAMSQDYGYRSEFDSMMGDVLPSVAAINYALKKLKKWMKPSKRHVGLLLTPSSVKVYYQPLGVVGVITPVELTALFGTRPSRASIGRRKPCHD